MTQQPTGGLEGYAALVTGGGTGIGKGCAARLAADGAAVTICGRTESRLVDAAKVIGDAAGHGGSVRYIVADVTDEDSVGAAVELARQPTGGLDAVIANAGGGGGMAPPHMQDITEFTRVLQLNVLGTLIPMKCSVPHLVQSGRGSFVGMSSIAGEISHLWFGAYPVAKAGLEALIRNAADEYGPTGVRFNAIRPGFISTEIMEGIPRDGPVFESYLENTPMSESREAGVGEPEDVAALGALPRRRGLALDHRSDHQCRRRSPSAPRPRLHRVHRTGPRLGRDVGAEGTRRVTAAAADRVVDLLDGTLYTRDPYPTYAWMREHAPVYWDPINELWGISRYDDILEIEKAKDVFINSDQEKGGYRPNLPADASIIGIDDPLHTQRRKLVARRFTPRAVTSWEDHVRETTTHLLDAVAANGGKAEIVGDLAAPLPAMMIGDLLGFPARCGRSSWSGRNARSSAAAVRAPRPMTSSTPRSSSTRRARSSTTRGASARSTTS